MEPTLLAGDRVLAVRAGRIRPGDLVALRDPRVPTRLIVKRVAAIDDAGRLTVVGDRPDASTDSRQFGSVERRLVQGRVVYRYGPEGRVGVLSRSAPGAATPSPPPGP